MGYRFSDIIITQSLTAFLNNKNLFVISETLRQSQLKKIQKFNFKKIFDFKEKPEKMNQRGSFHCKCTQGSGPNNDKT